MPNLIYNPSVVYDTSISYAGEYTDAIIVPALATASGRTIEGTYNTEVSITALVDLNLATISTPQSTVSADSSVFFIVQSDFIDANTLFPSISSSSSFVAAPSLVDAQTLIQQLSTSTSLLAALNTLSGITFSPSVSIPKTVSLETNYVSIDTSDPTLNLDYRFSVGASRANVITPSIVIGGSGGQLSLQEQYMGALPIIDSYPSMRKALLDVNTETGPATVLAGQIGLMGGDIIIPLGNGQWKRQ